MGLWSTIRRIYYGGKHRDRSAPSYTISVSPTPAGYTRTTSGTLVSTPGTPAQPGITSYSSGGGGGGSRALTPSPTPTTTISEAETEARKEAGMGVETKELPAKTITEERIEERRREGFDVDVTKDTTPDLTTGQRIEADIERRLESIPEAQRFLGYFGGGKSVLDITENIFDWGAEKIVDFGHKLDPIVEKLPIPDWMKGKTEKERLVDITSDIGKWVFFTPAFASSTAIERGLLGTTGKTTDVVFVGKGQTGGKGIIKTDVVFETGAGKTGIGRGFSITKGLGEEGKIFVSRTDAFGGQLGKVIKFPSGKVKIVGDRPFIGRATGFGMRVGDKGFISRTGGRVTISGGRGFTKLSKYFRDTRIVDFKGAGVGGRFGDLGIDISVTRGGADITRGAGITKYFGKIVDFKKIDLIGISGKGGRGATLPSTLQQTGKIISKQALQDTQQIVSTAMRTAPKPIISVSGIGGAGLQLLPKIKSKTKPQEQVLVSVRDFDKMFGGLKQKESVADILGTSSLQPPKQDIFPRIAGITRFRQGGRLGQPQKIIEEEAIIERPKERIIERLRPPIQRRAPPFRFDFRFTQPRGWFGLPPFLPPGGGGLPEGITTHAKRKYKYIPSLLPVLRFQEFGIKKKRKGKRKERTGLWERELGLGKLPQIKLGSLIGGISYSTRRSRKAKRRRKRK